MTYQAQVQEVQFQDPGHNSNKFYRAYVLWDDDTNDHRVLFQWGRIGSKGQSQVHVCTSKGMAEGMAEGKIYDKRRKGYELNYKRELPAVPPDLLHLAGVSADANGRSQRPTDPITVLLMDIDTARRLAMGDSDDVTKAVVMRSSLNDQLTALRASVSEAEGQVEVVDMLLGAKLSV